MSMPSAGPPSDEALSPSIGIGIKKQPPTSVPPERLTIGNRPSPTSRSSHSYASGGMGSPPVASTRSDSRSYLDRRSRSPADINPRTTLGPIASTVVRFLSADSNSRVMGAIGLPSIRQSCAPMTPAAAIVQGPMIQPRSVGQVRMSLSRRSRP